MSDTVFKCPICGNLHDDNCLRGQNRKPISTGHHSQTYWDDLPTLHAHAFYFCMGFLVYMDSVGIPFLPLFPRGSSL